MAVLCSPHAVSSHIGYLYPSYITSVDFLSNKYYAVRRTNTYIIFFLKFILYDFNIIRGIIYITPWGD